MNEKKVNQRVKDRYQKAKMVTKETSTVKVEF